MVLGFIKASAVAVAPTESPRNIVTIFTRAFCAVSESLPTTPDSLNKLPSINIPINGNKDGNNKVTIIVTTIGNTIFSICLTCLSCPIFILRSSLVVRAFIIGGCISGTSAIYEYAATAIGPSKCPASLLVKNIAVGPSAPPIIPIDAASCGVNPKRIATPKAKKIPNCAPAPISTLDGLASNGPKSVIAPTPKNISGGNISHLTPLDK